MRGKVPKAARQLVRSGITPAYAGKSRTGSGPVPGPKDHPRVCGEKLPVRRAAAGRAGSPPRMRGKELPFFGKERGAGITPAYAGKRPHIPSTDTVHRDHPRVCGEKHFVKIALACKMGSPPRMRGKGEQGERLKTATGITPAYAGKSTGDTGQRTGRWDHPRVCGEKSALSTTRPEAWGSPPRMRGKVVSSQVYSSRIGITPAYAGKRARRIC